MRAARGAAHPVMWRWAGGLAACGLMAIAWWSSSQPGTGGAPPFPGFDKLAHASFWALLGAAWAVALDVRARRAAWWLAVSLAVAYGAIDETHQAWVPGRDSSWADLLADGVGAMLGATLAMRWRRRTRAR